MKRFALLLLLATPAHAMDEDTAQARCRSAIKERLAYPDRAEFGPRSASGAGDNWVSIRMVTVHADSGYTFRMIWTCQIVGGKVVRLARQ